MEKYIIANLKMNQTPSESKEYFNKLKAIETKNQLGVAVPFTSIESSKKVLKDSKILLGAQNVYTEDSGAFTGEISAKMLKDAGCDFCIVGHSERRAKFGETNIFINKKIKALNRFNIKVVLCIGEKESEKESGKTKQVISKQLEECLQGLYENELENIIIAYEPVWSISTSSNGKVATPKQAVQVFDFIKQVISKMFSTVASEKIKIIYGGSVNDANAKKFLSEEKIQGALVGGAALNLEKFEKVINYNKK